VLGLQTAEWPLQKHGMQLKALNIQIRRKHHMPAWSLQSEHVGQRGHLVIVSGELKIRRIEVSCSTALAKVADRVVLAVHTCQ
jgi:hypothetical protein